MRHYLIANRALFGIGGVQGSMSLPVSGQVAAGGVILATLCTRVLWLDIFYLRLLLLGTAITCKKGLEQQSKHPVWGGKALILLTDLVCVCSCASSVYFEHRRRF